MEIAISTGYFEISNIIGQRHVARNASAGAEIAMTKFFITVRSISADAFGNNIGAIRYLAVPEGVAPAPSHVVKPKAWLAHKGARSNPRPYRDPR